MNDVAPNERGGTAWQVFAATHAPELGRIRFYLYHDRLGPFETLLDSMDVAVQRSPNLGDLARRVDPPGPSSGSARVLRGGYFLNFAQYLRSANRGRNSPGGRRNVIGARLLRIR